MKKTKYLILIVLFFSSIMNTSASENDTITAFKKNIDSLLVLLRTNPSNLKISSQLGGRKIKVKGAFDNGTKVFKHKIKYNGGVKKESIVVHYHRYKKSKLLLIKVICINDQYFFLQKNTYKSLESALKFSTETYVADRVYKRVEYDANKKKYKKNYLWGMLIPSERL